MADVHVIQWTAAFLAAFYLTARWLLTPPRSRWRHIVAGFVATLLWIPVAYTANNVGVADNGAVVGFGSEALVTFAIFMVVVNIVGLIVGLVLWTEEQAEDTHESLPSEMQHRPGRGD